MAFLAGFPRSLAPFLFPCLHGLVTLASCDFPDLFRALAEHPEGRAELQRVDGPEGLPLAALPEERAVARAELGEQA